MNEWQELMSKLTPREKQICEAIQQQPGLTYKGIGQKVGIREVTVKWHVQKVFTKLQINSKPELVSSLSAGNKG